jgi:subtilase family serine protease
MTRAPSLLVGLGLLWAAAPAAAATKVDYGPISHKGLKKLGAASTSKKLTLQLGLIANQSGLQKAVKAASNPTSSSYGKYPSLSTLASKYGASSSKRKGVVNAFKKQNVKATIDVTHLRATASVSIGKAQKMFGTKWSVYKAKTGAHVALPVNTPKLPSGIKGNVDTVAGARLQLTNGSSSAATASPPRAAAAVTVDGGTPTRTGAAVPGCSNTTYPSAFFSENGLFPNQILTAYGIAPLQASGLQGQGARLAIVGEAPTPASDVNAFRSCFGATGTSLKIHNAGSIKPIIESSLDAMVSSMVAPKLAGFDLWVHSLSEEDDDGDVEGFLQLLAQPVQATANGAKLPNVISVSYGTCESTISPFTAARTLAERQLTATAALGITTVVAAGDTGSSACARGVSPSKLTSSDKKPQASWPATSPWVLAVGGTNLTLDAQNAVASTGPWNDTVYPPPFQKAAGGGGGQSTFEKRPWWQPAQSFASSKYRMVPDVAAFADESPGYPIVCSKGVQGCSGSRQSISFVGGTSAAAPLVAGMIALWTQQARNQGLPRPGFIPPLLYATAKRNPEAFLDVTTGGNALFGGSCCVARPGFDLATGWGSPRADSVAGLLGPRG